MGEHTLDCRGMSCPMPIVEIAQAVKELAPGDTLEIEASDPAFEADINAWAKKTGNTLLQFQGGVEQRATIQKL